MKRILTLLFFALTASASSQFPMVASWQSSAAFSPTQYDSLFLWLDASQITAKAAGDTLHEWRDASGKGNHFYQLTSAKKPVYYPDSIGGKPAVSFDGVDDGMRQTLRLLSYGVTVFAVYSRRTADGLTAGNGTIIGARLNDPGSFIFYNGSTGTPPQKLRMEQGTPDRTYRAGSITTLSPIVVTGTVDRVFDPDSVQVYVNRDSTEFFSGLTGTTGPFSQLAYDIGEYNQATTRLKGSIAEIIVYSRKLNYLEIVAVENYLANKYGVTLP